MGNLAAVILAALTLLTAACAPTAAPAARYHAALDHRLAGQGDAYYREMLTLAAADPEGRAGRRARTVLQGHLWLGDLALLNAVTDAARPAVAANVGDGAGAGGATPHRPEAQATLAAWARAQKAFRRAHGRYCRTFVECGVAPPARAHYFYFLSDTEVAGGSDSQTTVELEGQIRELLRRRRIHPCVGTKAYYAVAAGTDATATALDVWAVDPHGPPRPLTPAP